MLNRIKNLFKKTENQSDGYHTYKELYEHRDALFLNLCLKYPEDAWWSRYHSDWKKAFGGSWVVVGIGTAPGKQITYHVDLSKLSYCDNFFNKIKEVPFAPTFDHHTSDDVLFRLFTLKLPEWNK